MTLDAPDPRPMADFSADEYEAGAHTAIGRAEEALAGSVHTLDDEFHFHLARAVTYGLLAVSQRLADLGKEPPMFRPPTDKDE